MKIALVLLLVASTAYANPTDEDVVFASALAKQDAKYFPGVLAVPFHAKDIPFRSAGCKQAFGGKKTISDAKLLPKLATCLGELVLGDPKAKEPPIVDKIVDTVKGDTCSSDIIIGYYEVWVELAATGERPYKVTGLRAEKMDGEIGGVRGEEPPMCSKKTELPPPEMYDTPQNVAPATLEALRKSGNKLIMPDDATKKEIQDAGKDRVVASWKLCIDTDGRVSVARPLKSTGFAAYDAKISTSMRAWTYRPFVVNGAAAPVCTAVTFIYAAK